MVRPPSIDSSLAGSDSDSEYRSSHSATTTSSSQSKPAPFRFNDELDALWQRCYEFVESIDERCAIHPLHLALVLLYDGLQDTFDSRLRPSGQTVTDSHVFERPLFWVAISRLSSLVLPESLNVHVQNVITKEPTPKLPIQYEVGKALWTRAQSLQVLAPLAEVDEGLPEKCCEETRLVLVKAKELREENGDAFLAPHHLLLAILELPGDVNDVLGEVPGLNAGALIRTVKQLRTAKVVEHESKPRFYLLNQFAIDLTALMQEQIQKEEIVDPIIGRNTEMRRLTAILSRKYKNNAVLLGDPGVGKTAIADGLAFRIVKGEVPESLIARVFSLDLGALLASTACKSAYESIVQMILDEVAEHEEMGIRAIIFLDELSQITIGGYHSDGTGIDAATLMKPYLSSGRLRCVGCSTFEDYRSSVEKDGALARQFSSVHICEPTVEQTIEILRGKKPGLEDFHHVQIRDNAFISAAYLASQYFAHKKLPDSAVELLDEACANVKIGVNPAWEQIGKLQRQKVALEMNIDSLEREFDEESEKELLELRKKAVTITKKIRSYKESADVSYRVHSKVALLEEQIKKQKQEIEKYGKVGEYDRKKEHVALFLKLEADKVTELRKLRDDREVDHIVEGPSALGKPPVVEKKDIISAASWYRPIHVCNPNGQPTNARKMENVLDMLESSVVGQRQAVESVASAVRCLMSGLTDPSRPVASFMLGGPTGSGKTLLAKELARLILGSTDKLVRIRGSDYADSHSITRLIGTPVCTGFDQGGQLTECVRRKPFSVILIEDIEEASREFQLYIKTILDEGSSRDGAGKVVDFTNCIVLVTTSVGQDTLATPQAHKDVKTQYHEEEMHYRTSIKRAFPSEFSARVDELIIFRRVTEDLMKAIVNARIESIRTQLSRLKLDLKVDPQAQGYLEKAGWSQTGGAQHLEQIISSEILRPLTRMILEDAVHEHWTVNLRYDVSELGDGIFIDALPTPQPTRRVEPISIPRNSSTDSLDSGSFDHPSPAVAGSSMTSMGLHLEGGDDRQSMGAGSSSWNHHPPRVQYETQRLF